MTQISTDIAQLRVAIADDCVGVDAFGRVGAVLTLNRPEKRNAVNAAMTAALTRAFEMLRECAGIRIVFLRGAGGVFTAGADLSERPTDLDVSLRASAEMYRSLAALPQFTVAVVEGYALGAGFGFCAACDEAVALETAEFACPEVKTGLIPVVISPYIVAAIGPRAARRVFMTGRRFSCAEATAFGLVSATAANAETLDAHCRRLEQSIRDAAPAAMAEAKLLPQQFNQPIDAALLEASLQRSKARAQSGEFRAGVLALRKRQKPPWSAS